MLPFAGIAEMMQSSEITWSCKAQKLWNCYYSFANFRHCGWQCVMFVTTRTTRMPEFWDTPRCPMITHTSDSHQFPCQNKTKSKLQILKNCQIFKFCKQLYMWHTFWSCFIRWNKYEMDPTRTVGATEWTRNDRVKPIYIISITFY